MYFNILKKSVYISIVYISIQIINSLAKGYITYLIISYLLNNRVAGVRFVSDFVV